ncbi:MAG: methionyl-tRNA formyltransferase [Calditrichaeota bacterium]|nr:MAG: methionyl-tRNA formyltransferase [Calditrichota bacterium]
MKIVFMGTPAFACPPLEAVHNSRHEISLVVTGPDKQSGRGRKVLSTDVAVLANKLGLPTSKPKSLKDESLFEEIKALNPDLIVVIAFRILPKKLFSLPKYGSINIHGSLLPKYRGAAPINWALINGESETGLSAFYLKQQVDTGDVIGQVKVKIEETDNFDSLYARMSAASAPFLIEMLDAIEKGNAKAIEQDESLVSQAPKITPFDALIDFGFPAKNVVNFVRGLSTKPGAYTNYKDKKIKILACDKSDEAGDGNTRPGTIIRNRKKLLVQCANSAIEIKQVIPEGKKVMDGVSFLNGFKPEIGDLFGDMSEESLK